MESICNVILVQHYLFNISFYDILVGIVVNCIGMITSSPSVAGSIPAHDIFLYM